MGSVSTGVHTINSLCCRSMSGPHLMGSVHRRQGSKGTGVHVKDFSVATPEEFVKRFGGDTVIYRVRFLSQLRLRHAHVFYHNVQRCLVLLLNFLDLALT